MLAGPMTRPGSFDLGYVPILFLLVAMTLENGLNGDDRNQSSGVLSVPGPSFRTLVDRTILG